MTPPATPATTATTSTPAAEAPPPASDMKCTLCGLSACWTEKEGAPPRS